MVRDSMIAGVRPVEEGVADLPGGQRGRELPASTAFSRSGASARTPGWWRSADSSPSRTSCQVQRTCCDRRRSSNVPRRLHPVLVLDQLRPDLLQALAGQPGAGQHGHVPVLAVPAQHPDRAGQLPRGLAGVAAAGAVGLVHGDDVGDLEDAALDALQLVAGAGEGQEQERVDHLGDGDLRLPDTDGLDQDDVVAGRLDDDHRLPGRLRDPAEGPRRRRGPDERVRVDRQPGHPGLVAEDRATRPGDDGSTARTATFDPAAVRSPRARR